MSEISSEQVSQVMGLLGSIKTEKKTQASRQNMEKARSVPMTEERRRKQSEAQKARRQKEREALGVAGTAPVEKRPPGRPRKQPEASSVADCETAPKRGRGRPRKELTQMTDTNG